MVTVNDDTAGALAHDPAEDRGAGHQEENPGSTTIPHLRGENRVAVFCFLFHRDPVSKLLFHGYSRVESKVLQNVTDRVGVAVGLRDPSRPDPRGLTRSVNSPAHT